MKAVWILVALAGCAQPGSLASRAAGANPYCIMSCHVTLSTVDGNTGDGLTNSLASVAVGGTAQRSRTTTETEQ